MELRCCRKAVRRIVAQQITIPAGSFAEQLRHLINCNSKEIESDTPDDVLASYLVHCLSAFEIAVQARGIPVVYSNTGGN